MEKPLGKMEIEAMIRYDTSCSRADQYGRKEASDSTDFCRYPDGDMPEGFDDT